MADEKSMLMQLCTENVYKDNIFHLLGLQTTATPREIRRRREDLESAHDMGEEAWKREFGHLLGNRSIPTFEEVQTAFEHIADPEYRIVSEFFWMWPIEDDDSALKELAGGNRSAAIQIWEQAALGFGKKRIIAQHNLAVLYQFYALDAELQALDSNEVPDDFHRQMCDYWEKTFSYWEDLADSDDFWNIFEARMRQFDDPRLTEGFARSLRRHFPVAFDNINAQIAARYAKTSRFNDAKRHVDYMSHTMSGLDDVQESMRIIFTPMERHVSLLIDTYDERVGASPEQGLAYAEKLLEETAEIRRIAEGMLKEGQRIRTGFFTMILSACNRYQVQYGEKTEEWEGCLKLLMRLREFACTSESKKIIEDNIGTIQGNIEYEKQHSICWVCQKRKADSEYGVEMYGEVQRVGQQIHWRHGEINVQVCAHCLEKKKAADRRNMIAFWVTAIPVFVIGFCLVVIGDWGVAAFFGIFLAAGACGGIAGSCVGYDGGFTSRCREHPAVKEMRQMGWEFGREPPTN